MVVMGMLTFLASAVLVTLETAKARAFDLSNEETISSLQKAALLFSLNNQVLPTTTETNLCQAANTVASTFVSGNYLAGVPKNDINNDFCIRMKSDGSTMLIWAPLKTQKYSGTSKNKQSGALVGNTSNSAVSAVCQTISSPYQGFPVKNINAVGSAMCTGSVSADKILGQEAGRVCTSAYDRQNTCSAVCVTAAEIGAGNGRYFGNAYSCSPTSCPNGSWTGSKPKAGCDAPLT